MKMATTDSSSKQDILSRMNKSLLVITELQSEREREREPAFGGNGGHPSRRGLRAEELSQEQNIHRWLLLKQSNNLFGCFF